VDVPYPPGPGCVRLGRWWQVPEPALRGCGVSEGSGLCPF
jgi:hypothetical protein